MFLGIVWMAKGRMSQGLRTIDEAKQAFLNSESPVLYANAEYVLGKIYLQIVQKAEPMGLAVIARNRGFLSASALTQKSVRKLAVRGVRLNRERGEGYDQTDTYYTS